MGLKITNVLAKTVAKKLPYIAPEIKAVTIPIGTEIKGLAGSDIAKLGKSLDISAGFGTKEEIIQYFKTKGINVRIEEFSDAHLETFNLIKEDVELLKRMGVGDSLPTEICLSDWRNIEKTKQIVSEYGFDMKFRPERRAHCGTPTNMLFINSSEEAQKSSNGVFRKFKHEIGHRRNYTHGTSNGHATTNGSRSVLGQGVKDNFEFVNRQLRLLGIEEKVAEFEGSVYSVTTPAIHPKDLDKMFLPIQTSQGIKASKIDLKKAVKYMNERCHCYNDKWYGEQIAEIFEDLLKGRRFDDLTMLLYDFGGGGRIPNLVIKGQKYDDYIKSLYENKELVARLKELILVS